MIFLRAVTCSLFVLLTACAPASDDAVELINASDGRACATKEAKDLLTENLMSSVFRPELPVRDGKGIDISSITLAYDPIVSTGTDNDTRTVSCEALAYFSLDGATPYVANTIPVAFVLSVNLNNPDEITLSGDLNQARDTVRILSANLGFWSQ